MSVLNKNSLRLSVLNDSLIDDEVFVDAAIQLLLIEDPTSTYTKATAGMALINYLIIERGINCYERGQIIDAASGTVFPDGNGDYDTAFNAINHSRYVNANELKELLIALGLPLPIVLKDLTAQIATERDTKNKQLVINSESSFSASCEVFRKMEKLNADEVTIEFVAGSNSGVGLKVKARKVLKEIALVELGLYNRTKKMLNSQGAVLLQLANIQPIIQSNKSSAAFQKLISNLRTSLKCNLGIKNNPIISLAGGGYESIIKIIDNRDAADIRAKRDTEVYKTVSLEEAQERERISEIKDLINDQNEDKDF